MGGIEQQLSGDIVDAMYGANAPSASNPFATMADAGGILPADKWYVLLENFDKGTTSPGWSQSTSGPVTVQYTQAYESGVIGQVYLSAGGPGAVRAGIAFGSNYNYILNFSDCLFTKWNGSIRRSPANVGVALFGLGNTNNPGGAPSGFGNVIAIVHDPNNMTGVNPGLITNWFIWVKSSAGQTLYDTGIAPTGIWQFPEFNYDSLGVEVKINNAVVVNVPITDPNLFVSQAPAAGAGLQPVIYVGKTVAASGNNQLRVDNFNLYRKWN